MEIPVDDGIVLYTYWRSSAAYRVRIGLELKGLAWEARPVHLVRDGGEQAAVRGDDRGDAGRGRADDRQPLLDRAHPCLGQMLRRAPAAEPGVVRAVEQQPRAMRAVDRPA